VRQNIDYGRRMSGHPHVKDEFARILRDKANVPMVCVSRPTVEVRRIATQVVLLDAGRVLAAGGLELLNETVWPGMMWTFAFGVACCKHSQTVFRTSGGL
jgi:ABC-type molybdate transport system ATPase subunit